MAETRVRSAARRKLPAVADLYARAFQDDPAYVWLFPDPAQRARRLPVLFRAFVQHLHRGTGALDVAVRDGRLVGAALWDRPGRTGRRRAAPTGVPAHNASVATPRVALLLV
ncbi:hypothetical protein ACQEVB_28175 [Pseudonocardia sp. CA-107938]|uniref:hypothetical protein n=1 Tax=Pseudonocardia sp. CA-107938 TaxID=3240021 RepID=UPI003D91ED02